MTMAKSVIAASIGSLLSWARSNSLSFISTGDGCCDNEVFQAMGCRYDLERFGCVPQTDPAQADLLFVMGPITKKNYIEIRALYDRMSSPKYVIAVGACACKGGAFLPRYSYMGLGGVDRIIPVDVYVPGCPPRPESIMNGLLTLQEKIVGFAKFD